MQTNPASSKPAFALPAVLIMSGGLLVLLTALLTIVELERNTSKARAGSYQAELAVESGLEEAKDILATIASSDSFLIVEAAMGVPFDDNGDGEIAPEEDGTIDTAGGERGRPYLYALQGEVVSDELQFQATPLFATGQTLSALPVTNWKVELPTDPGLLPESEPGLEAVTAVLGPKEKAPPVTNWRFVRDGNDEIVAQYSYWIEDMQGYLEPTLAPGNEDGRANALWPDSSRWSETFATIADEYTADGGEVPLWPAPGLNPGAIPDLDENGDPENRLLNQVALYTLPAGESTGGAAADLPPGSLDETGMDDTLRSVAPVAPTPASLLMLYGGGQSRDRIPSGVDRGQYVDQELRVLEGNITRGNLPWKEQALVPFATGLDTSVVGLPRLNLNNLLTLQRADAVTNMSDWIDTALPNFADERRGGFPEDYSQTLAANALDYADADSSPSVVEGSYRGIENVPFVSEYLRRFTYRWEAVQNFRENDFSAEILADQSNPFLERNGRKLIALTVRVYAEFWNQSNHQSAGRYRMSYQNNLTLTEGFLPEMAFSDNTLLENNLLGDGVISEGTGGSWHEMEQLEDGFWYFPAKEIVLEPNGYLLEFVGSVRYLFDVGPEDFFASATLNLNDGEENSTYRVRWLDDEGESLVYEKALGGLEVSELSDIDVRSRNSRTFSHLANNSFRELFGSFGNGMGDLRTSYYSATPLADSRYPGNFSPNRRNIRHETIYSRDENRLFGRTLPSEWPDGGHDASAEWQSFSRQSDQNIAPDDPRFGPRPAAESGKAPVFLSNLGRFFSESELGRVFDPGMWERSGLEGPEWSPVIRRSGIRASDTIGGGNTLRIGRPEHERFYDVGRDARLTDTSLSAVRLLDLFHCGSPFATDPDEVNGGLRNVEGHINVNTAPRDVLRALVAGRLESDPEIGIQSQRHDTRNRLAPRVQGTEVSAPSAAVEADLVADAIIAGRPYLSTSELALIGAPAQSGGGSSLLLGNKDFLPGSNRLQINDQATEEVFARLYNSSTVRSRNFRIHVIGQSLERTPSGSYRVKSTRKKSYRVFVNRGDGDPTIIDPAAVKVDVLYETNL